MGVQSWWLSLMLLDVTLLLLLHSAPCGLAGDFQPKDYHGGLNGGCSRSRTLSLPGGPSKGGCCDSCRSWGSHGTCQLSGRTWFSVAFLSSTGQSLGAG